MHFPCLFSSEHFSFSGHRQSFYGVAFEMPSPQPPKWSGIGDHKSSDEVVPTQSIRGDRGGLVRSICLRSNGLGGCLDRCPVALFGSSLRVLDLADNPGVVGGNSFHLICLFEIDASVSS
jgi:hypothetical protein